MASSRAQRHLLGETLETFTAWCESRNLPAYRARQVFEWVYRHGVTSFDEMSSLAKPLRRQLADEWTLFASRIVRRQSSTDGTIKLLLEWPDSTTSECVLIPDDDRRTACISSQVGCPVGCRFCASGLDGLARQLGPGEIVEQAMRVRQLCELPAHAPPAGSDDAVRERLPDAPAAATRGGGRASSKPQNDTGSATRSNRGEEHPASRLSNIVFMGLGEPLANYTALVRALRILNAEWGMNIGARKITVSTVGLPSQIRRLADENLQINLALSLHAPNDALRRELIPWAGKIPLSELTSALSDYFRKTGREVTLEYILLGGVNDQLRHADELAALCRRLRCNVNLIRYNPVAGLGYERPANEASQAFLHRLQARGVNAHLRRSRGLDIDAACGQLRRRAQQEAPAPPQSGT